MAVIQAPVANATYTVAGTPYTSDQSGRITVSDAGHIALLAAIGLRQVLGAVAVPAPALATRKVVTPQLVATRGILPSTQVTTGNTCAESRVTVKFGSQPCSDIQLGLCGFYVDAAAGGEIAASNDITMQAAIEQISPSKAVRASVNGQVDILVKAGSGITLTDPIGLDFAADEIAKVQFGQLIAVGSAYYLAAFNLVGAADVYRSALTASQVGVAGAWSAASRGVNQNVGASPIIIGRPVENYPSVCIIGDSIAASRDDNGGDAYGNHGFIARALYDGAAGGRAMPHANLSRSGERVLTAVNGGCSFRLAMLRYCSHAICNLGTNDVVAGATFAQMQGWYTAAWARMKRRGVQVWQVLLMPRTTSTDSWATAANQAAAVGFGVGGVRDQVNAWIAQQVGSQIDGVIDPNPYVEDQASRGKWITTGAASYATADGIHPTDAVHASAAAAVRAAARGFTLVGTTVRI